MISIGIDPGASGAVVVLRPGEQMIECRFDKATEQDVARFLEEIGNQSSWSDGTAFAVIEKVQPMPQMERGVISAFKLGMSYGFLRGCLIALGIAFEEVRPQKWERAMGITVVKGESSTTKKNRHKGMAQQLFPFCKVIHQNADALLIAEYCRRVRAERGDK